MIETRYVKSHHVPQFWKRKLHKSSIIVTPNCPYSDKLISDKCLFVSAIGAHEFGAHVRDLVGLKAIRMTDTYVWYIRIILVPRTSWSRIVTIQTFFSKEIPDLGWRAGDNVTPQIRLTSWSNVASWQSVSLSEGPPVTLPTLESWLAVSTVTWRIGLLLWQSALTS